MSAIDTASRYAAMLALLALWCVLMFAMLGGWAVK